MKISARRVGDLVWVFIFGGLFVLGMGISLERSGESYGWTFIGAGVVAVVIGGVLVWVRSRMQEP